MSYRPASTCAGVGTVDQLLARIEYADTHSQGSDPTRFTVGLTPLCPASPTEFWSCGGVAERGWDGGIGFAATKDLLLVHCLAEESDSANLADLTFELYRSLLAFLARAGWPYPLRIWNVIDAIHGDADGLERYRAFSVGRARAFDEALFAKAAIPAASAIGSKAPGLLVYLLAAREPGLAVENPRQVPAYHYPSEYGPRPPYFARATCAHRLPSAPVFVSGTASVVDHHSVHADSLTKQTEETLRNLGALFTVPDLPPTGRHRLFKVYLRHPHEVAAVEPLIRRWAGSRAEILFLRGDICRRELQIEIEAFANEPTKGSAMPPRKDRTRP